MASETENVAEEIQAEEIVQPQEENAEVSQETQVDSSESEAKDKDYNFKQLREKSRQAEEERDFYRRQVEELIKANKPPAQEEVEETSTVGDEDLIEGRHYKALESEVRKLSKHIQQKELETIPDRDW